MDAPWSDKKTLSKEGRLERLSQEILDFENYIKPTKTEQLNRDTLVYQMSQLAESLWPNNSSVTAFGSSVTGLTFPASDVDINIDFKELPLIDRVDILKVIRKQTRDLKLFNKNRVQLIAHAKVPVLMAVDLNEVAIDITVQNECFSSDRTAAWLQEYPALKPMFMILKQAIGNFRVTNLPTFEPLSAKTAGLASYGLICLIVSFLQVGVSKNCNPTDKDYYGTLLLGFLQFYSTFESDKYAIGLNNGGEYYETDDCDIEYKPGKVIILDPDMKGINVARSTLKFDVIQFIFKTAYDRLSKKIISSANSESILSSIIKVQHHHHLDPRREGTRFKLEQIWIENGTPKAKSVWARNKFGGKRSTAPYEVPSRFPQRFNDTTYEDRRSNSRYKGGYQSPAGSNTNEDRGSNSRYKGDHKSVSDSYRPGSYKAPKYTAQISREDNYYEREYQRHTKNNNTHLAQHYKKKAGKSKR